MYDLDPDKNDIKLDLPWYVWLQVIILSGGALLIAYGVGSALSNLLCKCP